MTSDVFQEKSEHLNVLLTNPYILESVGMPYASSSSCLHSKVFTNKTMDPSLPVIEKHSIEQHPNACRNAQQRTGIGNNFSKSFVPALQYNEVENYSNHCQDSVDNCHAEMPQDKPYPTDQIHCCPNGSTDQIHCCPNGSTSSSYSKSTHYSYMNTSHMDETTDDSYAIIDSNCLDIKDKDLLEAAKESSKSGSVLPLIKQEIRLKIQYRRLSEGYKELGVDFLTNTPQQLTKEDIQRRDSRRFSNRKSAEKSRVKRKRKLQDKIETISKLEKKNKSLKSHIQELVGLRSEMLNHFKKTCITQLTSPQHL